MSLGRKVIKSGIWLQVANFLQLGANFVITAILARLLTPEDFGLIGIVTVYTVFITTFTTVGLGTSIIQKQEVNQRQISTLYWLNFILGFFSTVVVAGTAKWVALFYGYPELVPLLIIVSLNFLISPFYQIHRKMLEKELRFPTTAKIGVFSTVMSGLAGITCAYLGFGVYSLVFQSLALNIFNVLGFRWAFHWHPHNSFALKPVKEMIYFSIKMKGAQLSRYFERNIDLFILGKLLPSQIFGFYALANRIIYFPIRRVSYTFTAILFPSFSKIQDDIDRIKKGYLKTIQIIAIFTLPFVFILALYARPLVLFILGEQWLPLHKIIFILSGVGAIQAIEHISVAIYPAINRPEVILKLGIIRTVITGIGAFIGGLYGLIGAAVAILLAKSILFIISMIWLKYYIKFTFFEIFKSLSGPLIGGAIVIITFFSINPNLELTSFELMIVLALSLLVYSVSILLTNYKDLKYIFLRLKPKMNP
ncbi:MAG: oligosaccharide flippase family protein [Candidatus Aminicenantes bacterium]|nr:oligosaccharide flippase family protein [Candidatus Aminicenantes bacterium]NIM84221.1 oligosaccharide flippase family protein [Candidatus Aminicenantes bacterium]NIN23670.1 oligosaccharide flippase family protein [Candidatus Aminicenantes bacterium]NIN47377.1 oligosaccharide flippase family protein [Candidatus Aminicenantes bacterium]NIN90305.1 oligosaccharide flippase family protein [Candidatus Aminicenantes bacterium]